MADALPLGPAPADRGRRRLAGPGHGVPLRRVRRRSCTARSATGSATGRRSTSRGAPRSWATPRVITRPGGVTQPPPSGPRTTCCSATASPSTRSAPRARTRRSASRSTCTPSRPPRRRRPTRTRPAASTALANRFFLDPVLLGRYPADVVARPRAGDRLLLRPRRRPRRSSPGRCRCSASTTTAATCSRRRRSDGRDGAIDWRGDGTVDLDPGSEGVRFVAARRAGDRDGLGDRRARPDRGAAAGQPRVPGRAAVHHRERRRLPRRGGPGRHGQRRRPAGVLRRAPARLPRRDRRRRAAARATSPGRCWTTSSGPGDIHGASAWSTWTITARSAHRRPAPTGMRM